RQGRSPARPEGERDDGPADSGRDRVRVLPQRADPGGRAAAAAGAAAAERRRTRARARHGVLRRARGSARPADGRYRRVAPGRVRDIGATVKRPLPFFCDRGAWTWGGWVHSPQVGQQEIRRSGERKSSVFIRGSDAQITKRVATP